MSDNYEREVTTDLDEATDDPPRGLPMHVRILIGLGVGVVAGIATNLIAGPDDPRVEWITHHVTEPAGALFLRLLLMIVVPLVFSALVVGVAAVGDIRTLGRVALRSFAYTLVLSAISVAIGLTLANTIRPGERVDPATAVALRERFGADAERRVESQQKTADEAPFMSVVKTIVPANPLASVAGETPNMLHLMFFGMAVGVALTLVRGPAADTFRRGVEGLYDISAKIVDLVMKLAPYAVAALLFTNTARFGLDLLGTLAWFVLTVVLGLSIQMFGVYPLSIRFLSKLPPVEFFRRIRTVILTAFSTSSSNATLPTALRVTEENLGAPKEINSFVLTVGATANQNGTALYEGVTVLFLAQLAGVELTFGQQLMVVYLAIIGGIGTAGVPSGSIPFIIAVLATIGVDPTLIAIILGVDRILDMARTTLNVTGDITAVTYVARAEGFTLMQDAPATLPAVAAPRSGR